MRSFIKRVVLLAVVLAILSFAIFGQRIIIPMGIFLGSFLSLYKIRMYKRILSAAAQRENKSTLTILLGILLPMLPLSLLMVSIIVDSWLFMGIAIGLFCSLLIILINIITETIGITHNEWVEWF